MAMVAWSEGRRPPGAVLHSSDEPGELSQWLVTCHDDSTINIVLAIIIIIIIIIIINLFHRDILLYALDASRIVLWHGHFHLHQNKSSENLLISNLNKRNRVIDLV